MEAERTTAVEAIAFTAKDNASPAAAKLSQSFERVQHAAVQAGEKVRGFVRHAALGALGAVGLGYGIDALKEKMKEANLEIEGTAKKIAGVHYAFGSWRSDITGAERWTA